MIKKRKYEKKTYGSHVNDLVTTFGSDDTKAMVKLTFVTRSMQFRGIAF
jgi:hypothetical protein